MFEFLLTFIVFGVYSWAQYDRPKKIPSLPDPQKHNVNGAIGASRDAIDRVSTSEADLCIEWQSRAPQPLPMPAAKKLTSKADGGKRSYAQRAYRLKLEKLVCRDATDRAVATRSPQLNKNGDRQQTNSNGNGHQAIDGQKTARGSILPEDANLGADLTIPVEEPAPTTIEQTKFDKNIINQALERSRISIGAKIHEFIGNKRKMPGSYEPLYDLLLDYPFRGGKMLRPTMCISTARAVGGMGSAAVSAATALELYHNAFLIHDDIEDASESRRGKGTLHHMIGIPRAINVGDGTNVLAVGLLLENLSVVGVTKTLNVLHEIEFMAQQSVEGQAMELDWVAENTGNLSDRDYFQMCVKKTCWYSFMTPCRIGLIVGHPSASPKDLVEPLAGITRFGMILGIAFQIQDDLLNLIGDMKAYGKEIGGDIYEGKRTLMLNHAIACSKPTERSQILEILATPRRQKTPDQIQFVMEQMQRYGSIEHGWAVARSLAEKAAEILASLDFLAPETPIRPAEQWDTPVHDRRFLKELINYVIYRNL